MWLTSLPHHHNFCSFSPLSLYQETGDWQLACLGVFLLNSEKLSSSFWLTLFLNSSINKTQNPEREPWFPSIMWWLYGDSLRFQIPLFFLLFNFLMGREDKPVTTLWDGTMPCSGPSLQTYIFPNDLGFKTQSLYILQGRLEFMILLSRLQLLLSESNDDKCGYWYSYQTRGSVVLGRCST